MEDNDNNGRQKEQSKIEITVEHSGVRVSVTTTNQMFKTSYFQNSYRVKGILEACLVNALGQIYMPEVLDPVIGRINRQAREAKREALKEYVRTHPQG